MSRSKTAALLGLFILAATAGAAPLCGLVLCGAQAAPADCHPVETQSTRLTDCCSAHSPEGAQRDMALDALPLAQVATSIVASGVVEPELPSALPVEPAPWRGTAVGLFTLHRSLLL